MALVSTMRVAIGMALAAGAQGFLPFADVEELKPQRLENFCEKEFLPSQDGRGRIRRCSHHVKKTLEDGGNVELSWTMNADPDSILSLDTEAEHGVRLHRCSPEELVIELPHTHIRHASVGTIVVGSQYSHKCSHLKGKTFLHKVTEVGPHEWDNTGAVRKARVRLGAQALEGIAHAVPYLNFHFSYMPVEAMTDEEHPEMVTDWGLNRKYLKKDRKLMSLSDMADSFSSALSNADNIDGVSEDDGGLATDTDTDSDFNTQNSFLNLQPKQISNFGWNWNFFMNTTQEPIKEYEIPGARARYQIHHPYIKVHAGISLNFTSEFTGITAAPHVQWVAGVNGTGRVQLRFMGSMNTTGDEASDPFHAFKLPVFQELEQPRWFNQVEFATGALPIKMEPGFQFKASMYHHGTFHGGISVGGKTRGRIEPSLTYDSVQGFDSHFNGHLIDTEIIPPLWLIFTKQFEMGVMGMPALLMRGDFAGMEKATLAMEGRPYMNITIVRTGGSNGTAAGGAVAGGGAAQTLTVYPYRVSGLTSVDFGTKYKVNVTANGQTLSSSSEINWGVVEFRDKVPDWSFGTITQKMLMEQPITVTLIEVDDATSPATETVVGTGTVSCTSLLNGECQPAPSSAQIMSSSGEAKATVDLAVIYEDSPEPWFASKIRGLSMSFPELILRQDALEASFPNAAAPATEGSSGFKLHLIYSGKTYIVSLSGSVSASSSTLTGATTIDFGPTILQNWMPCSTSTCDTPRLELYYGNTQVGAADLPQIDFSSQTAMQGTSSSTFMSPGTSANEMNVPAQVALYAPGSTTSTIAVVKMNMNVVQPMSSSLFLMPHSATTVAIGTGQTFAWTIADVNVTKEYDFTLTAYKLVAVAPTSMQAYVNDPRVSDKVLTPVDGSTKQVSQKCVGRATAGMSASQAPCSFETTFDFGSIYSIGDQIVVLISHTSPIDSSSHVMQSLPIEIVQTVTAASRRLDEDGAPLRRLWSAEAWNARVQKLNSSCTTRDLHFNLGAGMLVRGKVEQVQVPDGFPMIGGAMDAPMLATKFRKVAGTNGTDLIDLLGGKESAWCQSGLCQGELPGCRETGGKKLSFPQMVFDFSRPYHFNQTGGQMHGLFKTALAYAMASLPEMVDVMIKEYQEKQAQGGGGGAPVQPTAPAPAPSSNGWTPITQAQPAPAPSVQWPMNPVTQAPSPASTTVPSAFNRWWGSESTVGSRRLSSSVGSREELPAQLADNQVAVRFRQGLPYVMDRPLVEMMMEAGHFKGVLSDGAEATHGPLEITGFYIDSGVPEDVEDDIGRDSDADKPWYHLQGEKQQPSPARALPVAQGLGLAAVGALFALLVAALVTKRSTTGARYAPGPATAPEGLE